MIEALNKRNPDKSLKDKYLYYKDIAKDDRLKLIKFCDRRRNIWATITNTSTDRIKHHLSKYTEDMECYKKYDIGAEALENSLKDLERIFTIRSFLEKN